MIGRELRQATEGTPPDGQHPEVRARGNGEARGLAIAARDAGPVADHERSAGDVDERAGPSTIT